MPTEFIRVFFNKYNFQSHESFYPDHVRISRSFVNGYDMSSFTLCVDELYDGSAKPKYQVVILDGRASKTSRSSPMDDSTLISSMDSFLKKIQG